MKAYLLGLLIALVASQNFATVKPDVHIPTPYHECTNQGCSTKQGAMTIEASWRWLHAVKNYDNCLNGNNWDSRYCPDPKTCANNCGYEGVTGEAEYKNPYGVLTVNDGIRMNYVTKK